PSFKRFDVGFEAALEIVRMHAVGPAISHFLFHRATGKLEPRLVEKSAELVQARHPDQDGRRVSYDSETFFALAQRNLTRLEPPRDPRRAKHVVAQLVSHRRDNALIEQTRRQRHGDDSPRY